MLQRLKHSGLYLLVLVSSAASIAQPNITKLEYFIDADPGRGLGVDIPFTAAPNLNIIVNVPTGLLSDGFHLLTIRAQDQNGEWSLYENKAFFVSQSHSGINIKSIFIGNDLPGLIYIKWLTIR